MCLFSAGSVPSRFEFFFSCLLHESKLPKLTKKPLAPKARTPRANSKGDTLMLKMAAFIATHSRFVILLLVPINISVGDGLVFPQIISTINHICLAR